MPDTIPPPAGEESGDDIDVDFEDWAVASSKLLRRSIADRAQALRDAGLASNWAEVDERWYEVLVQDLDTGRLDRLNRYMEICDEELRLRAEREGDASSPLTRIGGPLEPVDEPAVSEPVVSDLEPTPNVEVPLDGEVLASVTPPLGSARPSSESIEIDLEELERQAAAADQEEDDDDDEPKSDDTRVSPS